MAESGVSPDVDTFSSVLFVLVHSKKLPVVRTWSLHVLNEMNQCGLGSFSSPSKNISRLQRVQNAAARVVTEKPSHSSSVDILHELHWLPVKWRINFKLASFDF